MTDPANLLTRRAAIKDMGKAGLAIMVFGVACSNEGIPATTSSPPTTTTLPVAPTTTSGPAGASTTMWERVAMANVSAYILYRNGEAALIDTGQPGAETEIGAVLGDLDISWDAVGSVIVTHQHPDHRGSVEAVSSLTPGAAVYSGAGDIEAIGELVDGDPQIASDGDSIFDLTVIATPGHTAGHISVLDERAGILVAGDALNNRGGVLSSASADVDFTEDGELADQSVNRLAGFDFEVVLFGHGDPILDNGSVRVAELASL